MSYRLGAVYFVAALGSLWPVQARPAEASVKPLTIGVFVALCDNEHQGIVPVPERIGNGEDPEQNLYWGCADGLRGVFDKSGKWKLDTTSDEPTGDILRKRTYIRRDDSATLEALAYRGSAIKQCVQDFESAIADRAYDIVAFTGHNGLMDFSLPMPKGVEANAGAVDCIILCCKSESYFLPRLEALRARPLLLTTQFMYPGALILHDALEARIKGNNTSEIRDAAGRSYAKNQGISEKAARGVFADLSEGN